MKEAASTNLVSRPKRAPKKPDLRGTFKVSPQLFQDVSRAAELREEPITRLLERAWRVFAAYEGELLLVPLSQRAATTVSQQ